MNLLSIIIPVYNVEAYIVECLDSVFNQWQDNIEVICINDGSTDSSLSVLNNYKEKLSKDIQRNFKVFSTENSGLSATRNFGISMSNSDYISFLDSDDRVNLNFISEIIKAIDLKNPVDIIEFNIETSGGLIIDIACLNSTLEERFKKGNWFACARVFRKRSFDLTFAVGINYEDIELVPELYTKANKIYSIPKALYWYRYNPNGITNSVKEENINKSIRSFSKILDKYSKINLDQNLKYIILCHVLYISTLYIGRYRNYELAMAHFNSYRSRLLPSFISMLPVKKKFFMLFPKFFIRLYIYMKGF